MTFLEVVAEAHQAERSLHEAYCLALFEESEVAAAAVPRSAHQPADLPVSKGFEILSTPA